MQLYYAPGACSIGIHVLLEELGKPFELKKLNLKEGEQYKPDFVEVNPKSKVPTLVRDDGSVLTEFPAIATWLARSNPQSGLLPDDLESQTKVLEAMDYVVATLHMQGFSRMFRPSNFAPNEADHEAVKAKGRELFEKGLKVMDAKLAGQDYVVGRFSVADAALFYVEFWAVSMFKMDLPPNCAAHYARMKARPAVQRAMETEGFASAA